MHDDAEGHYANAGHSLIEAKKQIKHGEWLPWLAANVHIGERRARELTEIASKKKTLDQFRARNSEGMKATRAKSASRDADLKASKRTTWRLKSSRLPMPVRSIITMGSKLESSAKLATFRTGHTEENGVGRWGSAIGTS
jgi:hypothetical protein